IRWPVLIAVVQDAVRQEGEPLERQPSNSRPDHEVGAAAADATRKGASNAIEAYVGGVERVDELHQPAHIANLLTENNGPPGGTLNGIAGTCARHDGLNSAV